MKQKKNMLVILQLCKNTIKIFFKAMNLIFFKSKPHVIKDSVPWVTTISSTSSKLKSLVVKMAVGNTFTTHIISSI